MGEDSRSNNRTQFDPKYLKKKYAEERGKRLRPEGKAQYRAVFADFPNMLDDPFDRKPFAREAVSETIDVLVVGAGMSGIMTAGALRKNGISNLRIIDGAADFGGTWYWNQYPGAQCDTEAYIYMPWLEEFGYVPTEKYARGPELFAYFRRLASHFDLYEKAYFKTKAQEFSWDEKTHRWTVTTNRGDKFFAKYICLCVGSLAQPKMPDVPGVTAFTGRTFITSRWDYDYTGGSPEKPDLVNLRDKRVAIIGTGCTAIQAVPALAEWSKELIVFQRTPSMINYRGNRSTDEKWAKSLTSGWQDERTRNFELCIMSPDKVDTDLVADGWTELSRNLGDTQAVQQLADIASNSGFDLFQLADFKTMENARARVTELVTDPNVAERLKPYYNVHCKRPTFHDEFLPTFNRPNVTLVDTSGKGIERISERGVVVDGVERQVDCIIFATGFEALSMTYRSGGYKVYGADGRSLEDKWGKEFRTLHGVFTNGFPNMALVGHIRDGAGSFNATYPFSLQAKHVGAMFSRCLNENITKFEISRDAEEQWAETIKEKLPPLGEFLNECTPGYLNNEGNTAEPALRTSLYGGGTIEYGQLLEDWRGGDGMHKDAKLSKKSN